MITVTVTTVDGKEHQYAADRILTEDVFNNLCVHGAKDELMAVFAQDQWISAEKWTMAGTVKLEISMAELLKLKQSPAVMAQLKAYALALKARANKTLKQKQPGYPDYDWAIESTGDNPHAAVFTRSNHAKYSNAKHNTLVRLI